MHTCMYRRNLRLKGLKKVEHVEVSNVRQSHSVWVQCRQEHKMNFLPLPLSDMKRMRFKIYC